MKNITYILRVMVKNRWFRLSASLVPALGLAIGLQFFPLTVQTIQIPSPGSLQPEPVSFGVTSVRAAGVLTVTKTGPTTVDSDDALTYTLFVTNGTGGDLTSTDGVFVADVFPNGTNGCVATQQPDDWLPTCTTNPGWQLKTGKTFTDGTTAVFTVTMALSPSLSSGFKIVNDEYYALVIATAETFTGTPTITTTVAGPNWEIDKTVSHSTRKPGQLLTYTITITNIGTASTSGNYTITDYFPNDVSFNNATPTETFSDATKLGWVLNSNLAPGNSTSVMYVVTVDEPLANGTIIKNITYTVSGGNVFSSTSGSLVTTTVDSPAALQIAKIAGTNPVTVGQLLTYTIIVTNNSTSGPAQGVVISDTLPGELSYQPGSATFLDGINGTINDSGNPIVWTLTDTIASNDSARVQFTVQVTETLPSPPLITNTFRASADNAPQVSDSMAVNVVPDSPKSIAIEIGSTNLQICETTTVSATLKDKFDNPIPGKQVNLSTVLGIATYSPSSGNTNTDGMLISTLRAITGPITFLAFWNEDAGVNGVSTPPINVAGPSLPTQLILNVSPSPLSAGGATGVVTATLQDCQNQAKPGETITLTLSSVNLAAFPGPSNSISDASTATGKITASLTSTSTTTANGTVTITSTASGPGWNLQDVLNLNIVPANTPALTITKNAVDPVNGATIESGGTITYELILSNPTGTAAATNIVITDELSADVGFVAGSVGGGGSGPFNNSGVITFSVPSLAVGSTVTAQIQVTVTTGISGTVITNTATASDQTGNIGSSNMVSHRVITSTSTTGNVYLPIVLKDS